MKIQAPYFTTTDLGLASALRALDVSLICLKPMGMTRIAFVFEERGATEIFCHKFWAGQLKVDALTLCNSMKALKSQLHSVKKGGICD